MPSSWTTLGCGSGCVWSVVGLWGRPTLTLLLTPIADLGGLYHPLRFELCCVVGEFMTFYAYLLEIVHFSSSY